MTLNDFFGLRTSPRSLVCPDSSLRCDLETPLSHLFGLTDDTRAGSGCLAVITGLRQLIYDIDMNTLAILEEIKLLVSNLASALDGVEVPKAAVDQFRFVTNNLNQLETNAAIPEVDFAETVRRVVIHSQALSNALLATADLPDTVVLQAQVLQKAANLHAAEFGAVRERIDARTLLTRPPMTPELASSLDAKARTLSRLREDLSGFDRSLKVSLEETSARLLELEANANRLAEQIGEPLGAAHALLDGAKGEIQKREHEVRNLVGVLSQVSIAGSFEKSASSERLAAESLRLGALALMGGIVLLVAITFFESKSGEFRWESVALRAALAFVLSIPSAYLARESAKHRQQQYAYQQTALQLKALDPYIASLPVELQNQIKLNISHRIFSDSDFSYVSKDAYPLNSQELLMELIKRVEIRPEKEKK